MRYHMAQAAYPETPLDRSNTRAGSSVSFPYLALHREEFTWPHLLPDTPVSSYLTVSPITHDIKPGAGIFSVALVVTLLQRCPVVIRLAALWCSDFPLSPRQKRSPDALHRQGLKIITKSVEQSKVMLQPH